MVEPIPLFRTKAAKAADTKNSDNLAFAKEMAALAKRGGDAPETLSLDEIREISITLEIMYAGLGIS